jgi:protein involved in ribonucleotide reduction
VSFCTRAFFRLKHTLYALFYLLRRAEDMIVVYDSLTGQGERFAKSLGYKTYKIDQEINLLDEPIFLVTRSFNFGEISNETKAFLAKHHQNVMGLAVSGNRNWGTNFGAAGDKIKAQYNIPLVLKFEASGLPYEIKTVKTWIENKLNAINEKEQ